MLTHRYAWKNNEKRRTLFGRACRVLYRLALGSVIIEFENGERECVSRRALRRLDKTNESGIRRNMKPKKQYPEWSEESFASQPKLVVLFDRMARLGRAMQAARARVAQGAIRDDNAPQEQRIEG